MNKIEVFFNDYNENYVIVVSDSDPLVEPFVENVKTFSEVESFIKRVEEFYPEVKIEINE